MRSALASAAAAMWRTLDMPRAIFAPVRHGFEPSHPEQLEALLRVAGQSLGECLSWVLTAIERAERPDIHVSDAEERKLSC
ncbi:hypothetical protein [Mesorhizobium sp. A623]